jgi:TP901 family phage tail tape measure protein
MARDVIADLVAQISIDGTKFDKGIGQVNRQLKTVQEELETARSQFRQTGDQADFLGNKSQTLSGKLKLQETRIDLLNKAYKESVNSTGEFSNRSQRLATQLERAKRQLIDTETELKDVNEQLRNLPNSWQLAGQQAQAAGEKMMNAGRNMTNIGRNMTYGVTLPIAAAAGSVFKLAADWETAFTGVEKTVDGTTEQLATLEQGIRDMAKEIPASTTEIAKVAEAAGQLGIKVENIEDFTRVMIDLGNTTNLSADQAATTFARFANIVGMSQSDFDKLGAVVVDLGNNLATTEAEITEMALRLAGAGSQIGLSESQILSFAASLSSVGIEAEAGGSAFSRVMIDMANSVSTTDAKLEQFASVAGMTADEFSKAFKQDAASALMSFISGLGDMSDAGENTFGILEDLGLSEIRVRDALLRASNASDVFTDALNIGSNAWEENTALTDEAGKRYNTTASKLEILWNRLKDTGITLGEALVPALMDALDAAEPLIKQIEDGAQAFADMDEEQQRTILKLIGLVAVAGPASMALGGITSSIGGLIKIGGSLSSLLGKAGGNGLLARIAGFGVSGPVGLAIAGVGALGLGIYALSQAQKDNLIETAKNIEKRREEIESLDKSIKRYDELQNKNKLSTSEVLRYMDIMDELKSAKNEDTIASLTEEQEKLREKSGLTNEEISEFLSLNETIVENSPSTAAAISEQGNAYVETADAARELNNVERERLTNDLYVSLTDQMDQYVDNLKDQSEYQQNIADLEKEREQYNAKVLESGQRLLEIDKELNGLDAEKLGLTIQQRDEIRAKISELETERSQHEFIIQQNSEKITLAEEDITKQQEKLDGVTSEIDLYNDMLLQYESMLLAEKGIVDEKGNAYESIQNARDAMHDQRMELINQLSTNKISTEEYDKQVGKINEQVNAIDEVQEKADILNDKLSQDIKKDVGINTNPSIDKLNRDIGSSLTKRINIDARVNGAAALSAYAEGTDYHPGGPALVGEEGPELAKIGNRWSLLDFGIKDLPTGTKVFTNDETNKILRSLPAYADGVSPNGEVNKVIDSLNGQQRNQDRAINQYITIHSPQPLSPSETARLQKQASRQLAMEW